MLALDVGFRFAPALPIRVVELNPLMVDQLLPESPLQFLDRLLLVGSPLRLRSAIALRLRNVARSLAQRDVGEIRD